jgi:methionyl-tRNA formyltransferase
MHRRESGAIMILIFAGKRVGSELLRYLIDRKDPIDYVVAASDADQDILSLCRETNIAHGVFQPELIERLVAAGRYYDWILDLWSPHILQKAVLQLATHRANLHPSLVPHARGADSTAWILRKGIPAGVSILEMTETIDGGGLYAQKKVDFEFPINGRNLHTRLQDEMVELFRQVWPKMLSGEVIVRPQPTGGTYHRRKQTNEDRVQDENTSMTLGDAVTWMLAHDFYPGTTAELVRKGEKFRVRVSIERAN